MKGTVQHEVILPIMTISEFNASEHWTKSRKRHQGHQLIIRSAMRTWQVNLPCVIELIRVSPRSLDSDNLPGAFKWIRDTIADQIIPGLAPGRADGDPRMEWEYHQYKAKKKCTILRIYDLRKTVTY